VARRRQLALLLTLVALGGYLVSSAGADVDASRGVHVDGDSLAVGTDLFLPYYLRGWTISQEVDVSRHTPDGVAALEAAAASLPHVVVVSLGTNDDPSAVHAFAGYVRRVIRAAGPRRCVVWSTVARPPYAGISYDGYNGVLRSAAARYPNLHVFDWNALAHANPSWFGADGVHPSMTGYRVRAAALARLIRKSC
jgi:hypothetical protein